MANRAPANSKTRKQPQKTKRNLTTTQKQKRLPSSAATKPTGKTTNRSRRNPKEQKENRQDQDNNRTSHQDPQLTQNSTSRDSEEDRIENMNTTQQRMVEGTITGEDNMNQTGQSRPLDKPPQEQIQENGQQKLLYETTPELTNPNS